MAWLLNLAYVLCLLLLSPWLLFKAWTTGKYRRGFRAKFFGLPTDPTVQSDQSPVLFHGVSVGEIHLLRPVIAGFRQRQPGRPLVVTTTTDTGFDEAKRCFPDLPVFFFPFDFSWAVHRTLRALGPVLIVLAESELWPNFLQAAREQGVPVAVINGRLSPRSFRRWRKVGWVARWLLQRLELIAVQTEEYSRNLVGLGADLLKAHVTGSVKFDGAAMNRHNPRTEEIRKLYRVAPGQVVWVAGSTAAPEEEIVLRIFASLNKKHPGTRLFLVPRQKDRFEEVARLIERQGLTFARRSRMDGPLSQPPAVTLVDTIGELSALWGLADLAFVGGSMDGKRGGQNMIEPAAYGAAVIFGPHVWNFRDAAQGLVQCGAAKQIADEAALKDAVAQLLENPEERVRLGAIGRQFVLAQQGATKKTLDLLEELLASTERRATAA